MKRYFVFLLCCLFVVCPAIAAERWAIVVGIGSYPETSGWRPINGDKDLDLVVPMLKKNGFPDDHITILANEQATKKNIEKAIHSLLTNLLTGDIVYFHFSGHGQLVTDINGDEGDYGYDESIVPYDAASKYGFNGYKGQNHLVDDELNKWLLAVRKRIGNNGRLLVVLDACHSGGGSRDEYDDEDFVRGSRDCFNMPVAVPQIKTARNSIKWMCVSACKSHQSNYEYKINDETRCGRLSFALSKILVPNITVGQLREQLDRQYENMTSPPLPQEPEIEYEPAMTETMTVL